MARKRSRRVQKSDRIGPTAETLAHLTTDPLETLIRGGWIDAAGERAVAEIKTVHRAITRDVSVRTNALSERTNASGPQEMPDHIAQAYHDTYLPWCALIDEPVIQATFSLVVDRNEIPAAMSAAVCRAIQIYAKIMSAN